MRVLVCGSREGVDAKHVTRILDRNLDVIEAIIEGCARGVDHTAELWATYRGIPIEHYPADWSTGYAAGVRRNRAMLDAKPDMIFAFFADPTNPSPGTSHMVEIAQKAGVPVEIA